VVGKVKCRLSGVEDGWGDVPSSVGDSTGLRGTITGVGLVFVGVLSTTSPDDEKFEGGVSTYIVGVLQPIKDNVQTVMMQANWKTRM
jgi:hypothetical protein